MSLDRHDQNLAFVMGGMKALSLAVSLSLLGASYNRELGEKILETLEEYKSQSVSTSLLDGLLPDEFDDIAQSSYTLVLDNLIEDLRSQFE